jgi:hypothetical protein
LWRNGISFFKTIIIIIIKLNTGYFTSDNEPGGIENATHNTSGGKTGYLSPPCPGLRSNV